MHLWSPIPSFKDRVKGLGPDIQELGLVFRFRESQRSDYALIEEHSSRRYALYPNTGSRGSSMMPVRGRDLHQAHPNIRPLKDPKLEPLQKGDQQHIEF